MRRVGAGGLGESAGDDLALSVDIAADLGDLDAAGRALDQADAQIPLELSHPFAELRLGLAGCARRGGEAAGARPARNNADRSGLAMTPPALLIVSPVETVCRSDARYR